MADLITPGSAVADTVQQILQRHRDEQRQAIMAKLQGEQMKDEFQTNDVRRQQMQDEMKTSGLNRQTLAEQLLQNQLHDIQDGTAISGLTPDLQAAARVRGYTRTLAPKVDTSTAFQNSDAGPVTDPTVTSNPGSEIFITPKEREKMKQEQDINNYIVSHADLQKSNPDLLNVLAMNAAGLNVPVPDSLVGPAPSAQIIAPGDHRRVTGPRGTQFIEGNWSPAAYQPAVQFLNVDKDGNGVFQTNRVGPDGMPVILRVPDIGIPQKGIGAGNNARTIIPGTAWDMYGNLRQAQNETTTNFNKRRQTMRQSLGAQMNMRATTPAVVDSVNQTIAEINRSENSNLPAPDLNIVIANARKNHPNLTQDEEQQIMQIVSGILNPSVGAQ